MGPGVVYAFTDSEIESMVYNRISELHPRNSEQWWKSLGGKAPQVIMGMYERSDRTVHKVKLLDSLRWFSDDPKVADFLKTQAQGTSEDAIRTTAIGSVAAATGAPDTEFLSKFLAHPDPDTRFAAANALKEIIARKPEGSGRLSSRQAAQQIYDKYLAEEKTPWILNNLNGIIPKDLPPLKKVSSSEDRISSDFQGSWKGFWISQPDSPSADLSSQEVTLSLQSMGATQLSGEISLKLAKGLKSLHLAGLQGKGAKISGKFPKEFAGRLELDFQGELLELTPGSSKKDLLEIHVPKVAGFLVLKRVK